MSFKDLGEKVDSTTEEVTKEYKKNNLFKYATWVIGGLAIIILLMIMFNSCSKVNYGSYQPPIQQQVAEQNYAPPVQSYPQPVYNSGYSGGDMAIAAAAGAFTGYIVGKSRMPDGSIYNGSESQKQIIVKKYYISHPPKSTPTSPTSLAKIKNPGDAEAEKQKQLMKQEADAKANRDKAIAERKASIMKNRNIAAKSGYSGSAASKGTTYKSSNSYSYKSKR